MPAIDFMLNIITGDGPTLGEALNVSDEEWDAWLNATEIVMQSTEENNEWEVDGNQKSVSNPMDIVPSSKRDVDANVDRFNASLVAGGTFKL